MTNLFRRFVGTQSGFLKKLIYPIRVVKLFDFNHSYLHSSANSIVSEPW